MKSMPELPAQETRGRLLRLLRRYPGLHLREVARRLEVDVGTAKYHLDRLEKHGYLSALQMRRNKHYFPRCDRFDGELVDRKDKPLLAHLRTPMVLLLVLQLLASGPLSAADLASGVDLSPSQVHYYLSKMERVDIVTSQDGNSAYALQDPVRVRDLLLAYGPPRDQVEGFVDLWESFLESA